MPVQEFLRSLLLYGKKYLERTQYIALFESCKRHFYSQHHHHTSIQTMSSASPSHSPDVSPSQPSHPIPTKRSPLQRLRSRFPKLYALTPSDSPTFKHWLRRCWLDVLVQLLCAAAAFIIYLFGKPVMPRYFPLYPNIYTSPWGLRHGQPYLTEYISTVVSAAVSFFVPFLIMSAISGMHFDSFWDANAAVRIHFLFNFLPSLPYTYIHVHDVKTIRLILTKNVHDSAWASATLSQPLLSSNPS